MDIPTRREIKISGTDIYKHRHSGATILIFHDHKSNKRKPPNFRDVIAAQWLPYKDGESYEVPCILGACYAVKKDWYGYVDGFWGHRFWGTLEPYISIKSYLSGGTCRVIPEAETGHIFKIGGTHETPLEALIYNKILISKLLFPDSDRLIAFLGDNLRVQKAKHVIQKNIDKIEAKRLEYKAKTVFTMGQLVEKFSLDYRK